MPSWDFLLCNAQGEPLAELTTASGKQLKFSRNHFAEAQLVLSHSDAAAEVLMQAIAEGPMPTMRAYRKSDGQVNGTLRFNGYLAPFTEDLSSDSRLITAQFRSPFGRLYGDGSSGVGRYSGASVLASEQEQSLVARALIWLYGGILAAGVEEPVMSGIKSPGLSYAGLGIGALATTGVNRSITYQRANVGQAIINLSEALNGFDFDETFVEEGETLALFNTYVSQGEERPAAQFQFGPGTLANVAGVQRTTASPANVIILLGANGLKAEVRTEASIAKYGEWIFQEQASDATAQGVLTARAEALAKRSEGPIKTLSISPDFGVASCPLPFDDFWLGDTVQFYGNSGAFQESMKPRVNELTIVVDENGFETTTIPDPNSSTPESPDALHTVFKVQA